MISLGVDIGKKRDPAALVQVEQDGPRYRITHCGRVDLGTTYPVVADTIGRIGSGADIVTVEANGVGEAVIDAIMANYPDLPLWRVTITAIRSPTIDHEARTATVGKISVVRLILSTLGRHALVMGDLEQGVALVEELRHFEACQTWHGPTRLGAQSGHHDDLVMALGLALLGFKLAEVHG